MWVLWYERNGKRLSEEWWVSNLVAESVLDMLRRVGPEMAASAQQKRWVSRLQDSTRGIWYCNGFNIADEFESADEMEFWSGVAFELARRICRNAPEGFDIDAQVMWVWASFDLQRFLSIAAHELRKEQKE